MAYSNPQEYIKFLKNKCLEHTGNAPCEGCNDGCAGEDCSDDCTCCPVGLVAVYDSEGKHIACLTPNDAEEYNKNNFVCSDGLVKLYDKSTTPPTFIGCVSESEFATLYTTVNP